MIDSVKIGHHVVGPGNRCFIIAEAGINHNGDMQLAHQLVDAAIKSGADAVKFQGFVAKELATFETPMAEYQIKTTGENTGQYKMLKALELSTDNYAELKKHCDEAGILYLCTPYDNTNADALDKISIAAFKIAATDTTNIPFLRYVAGKGRPLILSTGMSTVGEVAQAVDAISDAGFAGGIIILHCTSAYPAPIEQANLRSILTMQQAFCCPVGFSDHTVGIGASPLAVAVGACVIEKHFTLDRGMSGPDHQASLEPDELTECVRAIRRVETSLGDGIKRLMPSEIKNKVVLQKSLVARYPIGAGEIISAEKLTCKRPATGLPPSWFDRVVGKRAVVDIGKDEILTLSSIEWE